MDWPQTAEALMRSRFEAFKAGDADWLLASWHPSTRPDSLDLTGNPTWRGLRILSASQDGERAEVEFRASYIHEHELGFLHERSRFVREDGRWLYVDGDLIKE